MARKWGWVAEWVKTKFLACVCFGNGLAFGTFGICLYYWHLKTFALLLTSEKSMESQRGKSGWWWWPGLTIIIIGKQWGWTWERAVIVWPQAKRTWDSHRDEGIWEWEALLGISSKGRAWPHMCKLVDDYLVKCNTLYYDEKITLLPARQGIQT